MKATAENNASVDEPVLVVATEVGRLRGTWCGSQPVREGESLDIELDFARARSWPEISHPGRANVTTSQTVRATVTTVFEDEVIGVTIGSAAVQIELDAPAPPDAVGQVISLVTDDLEFHPSGL